MPHRSRVVALSALLLLGGCVDGGTDTAPTPSATASPSSSAAPTSGSGSATPSAGVPTDEQTPDDASFPADTGDDGGPAQAGPDDDTEAPMRVTGLRLSSHGGFSRLVVDLSGNGVPEWTVGYSEASGPGGGPVEISGDAFLRVQLRTGTAPSGQSTSRVLANPGPIVEARTTGFFEGSEEVLIGIRGGQIPFRAFALTGPGRIVIDVRPAD
jgi:hypothetical protein